MNLTQQEWQRFIDTGEVKLSTLVQIAKQIKANQPLSLQQQAIYPHFSAQIEKLILQV